MKKILFLISVLTVLSTFWYLGTPYHRISIVLGLLLWVFLIVGTWFWTLYAAEKAYKPIPWGTRFQRQEFWNVMCYGPVVLLFLRPSTKGVEPTSGGTLT